MARFTHIGCIWYMELRSSRLHKRCVAGVPAVNACCRRDQAQSTMLLMLKLFTVLELL